MMGCFLPCFAASNSKRRKHLRSANANPKEGGPTHVADGALVPTDQFTQQKTVEELIDYIAESKIKLEVQSKKSAKKVTFDLNVNTNEELSTKKRIENFKGSREEQEKAREKEAPQICDRPKPIALSRPLNPSGYRYQGCDFDDTFINEDLDCEKKGKDEEDNKKLLQEESSESLFSLSIDSRKQVSAAEKVEIEVNSPMRLRGAVYSSQEECEAFGSSQSDLDSVQHVSSVLSPLENLAQGGKPCKKTEVQPLKKEAKEKTKLLIVKLEQQPSGIAKRKVTFNLNVKTNEEYELIKKLEENNEEEEKAARPWNPLDYRYQDCSDEGYEDINLDKSDLDVIFGADDLHNEKKWEGEEGGDVNRTWILEESSESLFSLSSDSRKRISADNEVNSPMPARATFSITEEEAEAFTSKSSQSTKARARIQDVSSVLNPVENLTQVKVVKATVMQPLKKEKENINIVQDVDIPISPEPSLKLSNRKARHKFNDKKPENGVDTSFSTWLFEQETTPISKNSTTTTNSVGEQTPKGGRGSLVVHEDRPILGALSIEELMKFSVSTSSRGSRSQSPDETPIIGTVGSYWSHTGQTMDSDSSTSCGRKPNAGSKSGKVIIVK